jgi:hypothetical protein
MGCAVILFNRKESLPISSKVKTEGTDSFFLQSSGEVYHWYPFLYTHGAKTSKRLTNSFV